MRESRTEESVKGVAMKLRDQFFFLRVGLVRTKPSSMTSAVLSRSMAGSIIFEKARVGTSDVFPPGDRLADCEPKDSQSVPVSTGTPSFLSFSDSAVAVASFICWLMWTA